MRIKSGTGNNQNNTDTKNRNEAGSHDRLRQAADRGVAGSERYPQPSYAVYFRYRWQMSVVGMHILSAVGDVKLFSSG